jgi:hypothetical protein
MAKADGVPTGSKQQGVVAVTGRTGSCGIRWYFRFRLSLRDIEDLLFERGVIISYKTAGAGAANSARDSRIASRSLGASAAPHRIWTGCLRRCTARNRDRSYCSGFLTIDGTGTRVAISWRNRDACDPPAHHMRACEFEWIRYRHVVDRASNRA